VNQIDALIEQHIRESESHLRHIDEMMAKARAARAGNRVSAEHQSELLRLEQDHTRLTGELHALRTDAKPASDDAVKRSEGLRGLLQTVGVELERTLVAIGDTSGL